MAQYAMCVCGEPLMPTFHWSGKEFVCLECGRLYEFFGPTGKDATPELDTRYEELQAEWEPLQKALITPRGWKGDCDRCKVGDREASHEKHATEQEQEAHAAAMAALRERWSKRNERDS